MRSFVRRFLLVILLPILVATACGIPEDNAARPISNEALPEALRPIDPVPTTTAAPNPGFPVSIYFFRQPTEEEGGEPELVARTRLVPQPSVESALEALLTADPTEEEEDLGLSTFFGSALPEGDPIELISAITNSDLVRIDLSRVPAIEGVNSPVPWAQLVFTATQQFREGVGFSRVRFLSQGERVPVQIQASESQAGRPVFRADYSRYDPSIEDEDN